MPTKTKIEWCDYTINPIKGLCPMRCSYCYARRMYKRFKWNPEIRYVPEAMIAMPDKPSRIFIGSTIELFGDWVKDEWMAEILLELTAYSQHTFLFLTKKPENLKKWEFPDNCWVGASATNYKMFAYGLEALADIQAGVKFVSIEPMLDRMNIPMLDKVLRNCGIGQVIIGQQTPVSKKTAPRIEWITEIVEAADKAGVAIYQKNNLRTLLGDNLRQEFPESKKAE